VLSQQNKNNKSKRNNYKKKKTMSRQHILFELKNSSFLGLEAPVMLIFSIDMSHIIPDEAWRETDPSTMKAMTIRRRLKFDDYRADIVAAFDAKKLTLRNFRMSRRKAAFVTADSGMSLETYMDTARTKMFNTVVEKAVGKSIWFFPFRGDSILDLCSWMRERSVGQKPVRPEEWLSIVESIMGQVQFFRAKFPDTYPSESDLNMDKLHIGYISATLELTDLLLKTPRSYIPLTIRSTMTSDIFEKYAAGLPLDTETLNTVFETAFASSPTVDALAAAAATTTTTTTTTTTSIDPTVTTTTSQAKRAVIETIAMIFQQSSTATATTNTSIDLSALGTYTPTIASLFTQKEKAMFIPLMRGSLRVAFNNHSSEFGIQVYHLADRLYWLFNQCDLLVSQEEDVAVDHVLLARIVIDQFCQQKGQLQWPSVCSQSIGQFFWDVRVAHFDSNGDIDNFIRPMTTAIKRLFKS
jgi:hypothetical protein